MKNKEKIKETERGFRSQCSSDTLKEKVKEGRDSDSYIFLRKCQQS